MALIVGAVSALWLLGALVFAFCYGAGTRKAGEHLDDAMDETLFYVVTGLWPISLPVIGFGMLLAWAAGLGWRTSARFSRRW